MQSVIPPAGNALATGVETQAPHVLAHGLKVLSVGTASTAKGTPSAGVLHTFASVPPVSTSTSQPAPASPDDQLLRKSVESNLTSSEIIGGTTLLRQMFQPKGTGSDGSEETMPRGRAETHIEKVVRESLQDPIEVSRPQTRMEQVVQKSLTDPIEPARTQTDGAPGDSRVQASGTSFMLSESPFTHYEADKIKITRWREIDSSKALERLKGTKWEGVHTRFEVDISSGDCFYGVPVENEFGTFYPLQITRDGLCIETSVTQTVTPIGSHHDVIGEGVTKALLEKSRIKESENFGPKRNQLNLLNTPYTLFKKMGGDFFAKVNTPFLLEAIGRRDPIPVLTPISMGVTHRLDRDSGGLQLSGFARELMVMTQYGYVYHQESSRFINGDEITRLLRQGGKLEKVELMTDKAYLYHEKSNRFYKGAQAEKLIKQGEILTRPTQSFWKISVPGKALVPFEKRPVALSTSSAGRSTFSVPAKAAGTRTGSTTTVQVKGPGSK